VHPEYRILRGPPPPLEPALTPVYPAAEGISQRLLRDLIAAVLPGDAAPAGRAAGTAGQGLPGLGDALHELHQPAAASADAVAGTGGGNGRSPALTRLVLEELCAHQLALMLNAGSRPQGRAPALRPAGSLWPRLLEDLPFTLTRAQERAIAEIRADLAREVPMNRLLQGDVGSGKTLVAVAAALTAIESGYQVAFMAPTELLARQHARNLAAWLDPLGIGLAWLGGRQRKSEREALLRDWPPGNRNWRSAPMRCSRSRWPSTGWGSRSSMNSTASACTSAWRCATRAAGWCRTSSS
jgi:ATP-dependent DNA helicase RecG